MHLKSMSKSKEESARQSNFSVGKRRDSVRYSKALIAASSGAISRLVAIAGTLISVGLTAGYLGNDRLGIWMAIGSLIGAISIVDLGVGNALTSRIATVAALDDRALLRDSVSGGIGILVIQSILVTALLLALVILAPWSSWLAAENQKYEQEIRESLYVFVPALGLSLVGNGAVRIFAGLQSSGIANAVTAIGGVVSLMAIYVCAAQKMGIPYLLAATLCISSCSQLALVWVLQQRKLLAKTEIANAIRKEWKAIGKLGGMFLVFQLGVIVGWGMDPLLISSTIGLEHVASYVLMQRICQCVNQPVTLINSPLWAAYADAYARRDYEFIRKTCIYMVLLSAVWAIVFAGILSRYSESIIEFWTSGKVRVDPLLVIAFASWSVVEAISIAYSTRLLGTNTIRALLLSTVVVVLLGLPLKVFILNAYGVAFMLLAFTIVYAVVHLIMFFEIYRENIGPRDS